MPFTQLNRQVSNLAACIKVACDFLCVEGVTQSQKIAAELRRERIPDTLQLETVLWDAWTSLVAQRGRVARLQRKADVKGKTEDETLGGSQAHKRQKTEHHAQQGDASAIALPSGPLCPHRDCDGRSRRFAQLNGVFTHLYVLLLQDSSRCVSSNSYRNDVHKVRIHKTDQKHFAGLDDEAFKDLFQQLTARRS